MSRNFVNKPKCADGSCASHMKVFKSKAGKEFNKCAVCENLVFEEKAPCQHVFKSEHVSKKDGPNKGKAYQKCADSVCNKFLGFIESAGNVSNTAQSYAPGVTTFSGGGMNTSPLPQVTTEEIMKRLIRMEIEILRMQKERTEEKLNASTVSTNNASGGPGHGRGRQDAVTDLVTGHKRPRIEITEPRGTVSETSSRFGNAVGQGAPSSPTIANTQPTGADGGDEPDNFENHAY